MGKVSEAGATKAVRGERWAEVG